MSTVEQFDPGPWQRSVEAIVRRHGVPHLVTGVVRWDPATGREQRMVASAGVTNLGTGVPTDPHTLCQIGSITKVVTATMILQLRDEGRLALDDAVSSLLPDLRLAGDLADRVTVRHLLTHTSGLDGDLFTDTGRGDDCLEKYVATLAEAESLFSPGTGWSYCNSGFVLLGRIIEVLDERTWDASLRARISEPLGLTRFVTLPEEVLLHRAALGHIRFEGAPTLSPAPVSSIPRSMGPAGLITSSVDDLLSFGLAFLRGGDTGRGARLLSAESLTEMTDLHHTLPEAARVMAPEWALGWMRDVIDGHRVIWHGGTTIGQNAWLLVLPDDGVALVVFTNGPGGPAAADEVKAALLEAFVGARATAPQRPAGPPEQATITPTLLGDYTDAGSTLRVQEVDGELQARVKVRFDRAHPDGMTLRLHPTDTPDSFLYRDHPGDPWATLAFAEVDGRQAAYLGIRALPRREDGAADLEDADGEGDAA